MPYGRAINGVFGHGLCNLYHQNGGLCILINTWFHTTGTLVRGDTIDPPTQGDIYYIHNQQTIERGLSYPSTRV